MNKYLIADIREYIDIYLHGYHYGKVCDEYRKKTHVSFKCNSSCYRCSRYYGGLEEKNCDALFSHLSYKPYENDDSLSYNFNYRSLMVYQSTLYYSCKYRVIGNIFGGEYIQLPENYGYTHFSKKSLLKAMGKN